MALIDLTKKVTIVLDKKGISSVKPMRVGFALDISGSMEDEYRDGSVQTTFDRMLAIASSLDSNGEMDVWTFHTEPSEAPTATSSDYSSYIKKKILDNPKISKWGGTSFSPVLKMAVNKYYGKTTVLKTTGGFLGFGTKQVVEFVDAEDKDLPVMLFLITDGENNDRESTEKLFVEMKDKNIYFNLIAVSNQNNFNFIKSMADKYPNVGFVHLKDFKMSDEDVFNAIITDEVINFLKV